jgi:hypothetical protein
MTLAQMPTAQTAGFTIKLAVFPKCRSLLIPARLIFAPASLVLTLSCGKYAEWVQRGKLALTRDATRRNFLNRSRVRTAT